MNCSLLRGSDLLLAWWTTLGFVLLVVVIMWWDQDRDSDQNLAQKSWGVGTRLSALQAAQLDRAGWSALPDPVRQCQSLLLHINWWSTHKMAGLLIGRFATLEQFFNKDMDIKSAGVKRLLKKNSDLLLSSKLVLTLLDYSCVFHIPIICCTLSESMCK